MRGQGLTGVLCQERQVQISSVSVCVCTVPDHNALSGVAEVYEFMGALVNRILRANGNGAVVTFRALPCESSLLGGGGQVGMCLFIFLKDVGRLLLRLCLRLLSARRLQVPPLQAAGGERLTFPPLPSIVYACLPGLWCRSGVGESCLLCACVFWAAMGGVCNCQEYQSHLKVLLLLKLIFFSVLSPCPERIGMCINSFKSHVKSSHKVE